MTIQTKASFIAILAITISMNLIGCKKKKPEEMPPVNEVTDAQLLTFAQSNSNITWFENNDTILAKSIGSAHPQSFMRTKYNSIAATKLGSDGRIMTGAIFPEGSIIVKELYTTTTNLDQYAVLYKKPSSSTADANGWVWGYVKPNGTVVVEAAKKGASCINCHSQSGSIDMMLMNAYF